MVTELEMVIQSFLREASAPEDLGQHDEARYWKLADEEVRRIVTQLAAPTPMLATAADRPALLCFGERGPAVISIDDQHNFVVHHARGQNEPVRIREVGPMADLGSDGQRCRIELDIPGLPAPIVVSGFTTEDLEPRRSAIFAEFDR